MKPARNAFSGYTYQQSIIFLILCQMDAMRQLSRIEIEAPELHNFEDIVLQDNEGQVSCQIKDLDSIVLTDIVYSSDYISIGSKRQKLSQARNILFLKKIDFEPNSEVLGFPAFQLAASIYIVSLSREEAISEIESYYPRSPARVKQIEVFFSHCLDNRIFTISRVDLPTVAVFSIELDEESIELNVDWVVLGNRLIIEGKPGIGKSHLVASIVRRFPESIVYRFWVSSQDAHYRARLQFHDFLFDLSRRLFSDYRRRSENEIIEQLAIHRQVLLIDGVDHVKNYHPIDFEEYLRFFEAVSQKVQTILITRPIGILPDWQRKQMHHWDERVSTEILDSHFHIEDYNVRRDIFCKTDGYPLLIKYYAEHYRKHRVVPSEISGGDIDTYYGNLFSEIKARSCLTIFLSSRSYFTFSEIELVLGSEMTQFLTEIVSSVPYLFEIRLNRISLFHDSFDTFVKMRGVDSEKWRAKVNDLVFKSLMELKRGFFSRMAAFDLEERQILELSRKYASMGTFEATLRDNIDYEALQVHYQQIHEAVCRLDANDFDIYQYYDLVLILNILGRDHVSSLHSFMFTFCQSLIFNGYSFNDVASSGYLFSMFYFIETGDSSLVRHQVASDNYSVDRFEDQFIGDIDSELKKFTYADETINLTRPLRESFAGKTEHEILDMLQYVLLINYSNGVDRYEVPALNDILLNYLRGDRRGAASAIAETFKDLGIREVNAGFMLSKVEATLNERGINTETEKYSVPSLREFIKVQNKSGSFDVWVEILNYVRLHLHSETPIDIESISLFWVYYAQRKDYTAVGVSNALLEFEQRMLIVASKSIGIIARFQALSEKGIRHILAEYLEKSPPQVISVVEMCFAVEDLEVTWFQLPPDHVNRFSRNTFACGMRQLLRRGQYDKTLELDHFESVLLSGWANHCAGVISELGYSVKIDAALEIPQPLIKHKVPIIRLQVEQPDRARQTSEEHYKQGTLDQSDKPFIVENGLSPPEIARTLDGWHHALSDITLFSHFSKEQMNLDLLKVLHGSIGARVVSINHFGYLFEMIGNVPALLDAIDSPADFYRLFSSFRTFLVLSLCMDDDEI